MVKAYVHIHVLAFRTRRETYLQIKLGVHKNATQNCLQMKMNICKIKF